MAKSFGNNALMDALGIPPNRSRADQLRKAADFLPTCNELLVGGDVIFGILLGCVARYVCYRYDLLSGSAQTPVGPFLREVLLGSVIVALVLREPRLAVDKELFRPRRILVRTTWRAVLAVTILVGVGLTTRGLNDNARQWLLAWCAMLFGYAFASRLLVVSQLHGLAMRGALREAVAVVGAPDVAGRLAARLAENAAIVRIVDDLDAAEIGMPSDALSELLELARAGGVDTVVVALRANDSVDDQPALQHLRSVPVQLTVCSDTAVSVMTHGKLRLLSSVPISVVADRPMQRWDLLSKAAIDRVGALLLLLVLSPVMLLAALAVVWDSPGPVIFCQRRSGWGGRPFTIYKFRTMRHAPGRHNSQQTRRNDPRCTRVGVLLRRTSLDELPQLLNVLRGDMSMVGPRPHADVMHKVECTGCSLVAEYAHRHRVKPGLTGWAQIHGSRGAVTTTEGLRRRLAYDLYYIEHWSIWLDMTILARTPLALLQGGNAY